MEELDHRITLTMTPEMEEFLMGLLEDDLRRTESWAARAKNRTTERAKKYEAMQIKALIKALDSPPHLGDSAD